MDLFSIPLFDAIRTRMHWLETRQQAISENISHSDMPAYRAKDVSETEFQRLLEHGDTSARLVATNPKHLRALGSSDSGAFRLRDTPDREISPTGNTVVLEDQTMKLSETQMSHQMATSLYRKAVDMLRLAIHRA